MDILQDVATYSTLGWRMVVCHGVNGNSVCTCTSGYRCESPGKHPRLKRWQDVATSDADAIREQLTKYPQSNLGIRLGPDSDVCDIEFDDAEGQATAERLLGDFQATPTYQSSRSTHRLYRFPTEFQPAKAVMKAAGLECRFGTGNLGAQSIIPPSQHASGVAYRWLDGLSPEDVEPMAFPASLVELLEQPPANGDGLTFVMADDSGLLTHPGAAEGSRNQELCRLVGRHLGTHGATPDVLQLAVAWGERCRPPMRADEVGKVVANLLEKESVKRSQPNNNAADVATPEPVLVRLSDVTPEEIRWLWPGRIAVGKVTLLSGDPGLGKSFLTLDIAARVTTGRPWVDCPTAVNAPGSVVLLSGEDDIADTIVPRLNAAGADCSRIVALQSIRRMNQQTGKPSDKPFCLQTDLDALAQAIESTDDCRLVTIDPISGYMGNADSHKNAEVRAVLTPLAELAAKYRVAVLAVSHLNKNANGPAVYRSMGSLAFTAAARAVWGVVKDKEDPQRRLVLPIKNNIAADISGLAYRLEECGTVARVDWEPEPLFLTADEAMQPTTSEAGASAREQAADWLREHLADGPVSSKEVIADAREMGHAQKTVRRAYAEMGGKPKKTETGWFWELPDQDGQIGAKMAKVPNPERGHLGHLDRNVGHLGRYTF